MPAAWRDFRGTTGSAKRKERKEKKKALSLGFFYRTVLHCCWVCTKSRSWLKKEGFWVEGNTEIYIFNGLISSWSEKWRAVKLLELKTSDSKGPECCIASGDCQLSAISTPFVILFVWEQTVYHLIRFITNAEQDCTENTETCTVRVVDFHWDLFQDSKTLIYQLSPLEAALKARFRFPGERSLSFYLQPLVISWGDRQFQTWSSLTEFWGQARLDWQEMLPVTFEVGWWSCVGNLPEPLPICLPVP